MSNWQHGRRHVAVAGLRADELPEEATSSCERGGSKRSTQQEPWWAAKLGYLTVNVRLPKPFENTRAPT